MSRFHPVLPKKRKHKHHHQPGPAAQAPAAPANPRSAEVDELADRIYGYRGGEYLDASIERWKKLLEVHDREVEAVSKREIEGGYRWTVSPAIAFRIDKHLAALVEQRMALKIQCLAEARDMIASGAGGDSLCLAKDASPADTGTSSNDSAPVAGRTHVEIGGAADAGPIAA